MNIVSWQRLHGGTTHFPIVLLLASVIFDLVARRSRDDAVRRGLHAAGFSAAIAGVAGGVGAVISGLAMTHGEVLGRGYEKIHHLFVWPAFTLSAVLVGWRALRRGHFSPVSFRIYLTGMSLVSVLMLGAGYWGGEMLLGAEDENAGVPAKIEDSLASYGHKIFLANCAHCHGKNGAGDGPDDGEDLRDLGKSDARIARTIRNGVKDEMPKFSGKLTDAQIKALTAYVQSIH